MFLFTYLLSLPTPFVCLQGVLPSLHAGILSFPWEKVDVGERKQGKSQILWAMNSVCMSNGNLVHHTDFLMNNRQWKTVVTHTNHRSPEKALFEYENLVQTIRLTLIDGFKHDEPEITAILQDLSKTVPTIFAGLLPQDTDVSKEDAEDLDDPTISMKIVSDENHHGPSVLVRIKDKHCKEVLGLPVREAELSVAFRAKLRDAYRTDYDKNIIAASGSRFKWWKKVSFANRYVSARLREGKSRQGYSLDGYSLDGYLEFNLI
ncbi:hypothetical protein F4679DRAFT_204194 [Xylaria curta]|nr:hypothetical protein F4679DRAFT_204194 [Xylaria curta]